LSSPTGSGTLVKAFHRPGLERTAAGQRVRFVRDASARDRLTMHAVALVVVHLRDRCIDRDLVEIDAAQTGDLRIQIRMDAALQQRVVAEIDTLE
jgi:hypothetical protein